jgi:hypothetical protein
MHSKDRHRSSWALESHWAGSRCQAIIPLLHGAAVAALAHYTSGLEAEMENKQKQSSRNNSSRNE